MTADRLKRSLASLTPARHTEIRQAYFAIGDALPTLTQALELADLECGEPEGPLLEDHFTMLEIVRLFDSLNVRGVL